MNPSLTDWGIVILFGTAFVLGVQATITLWRMAADTNPQLREPRAYLVLRAFVVVSLIVTIAAAYFGILLGRRLFGLPAIEGITPISMGVVAVVVMIPQGLLWVVRRVAAANAVERDRVEREENAR